MLDLHIVVLDDGGQVGPFIPVSQLVEIDLELVQLFIGHGDAQLVCAGL